MQKLLLISIIVLIFNIPFGYWRANVRTYSLQWILAIHIPVPFVIAFRLVSELGFIWYTYVFLVTGFFLGQQLGSFLLKTVHHRCDHVSSCLVMDLVRCLK